jgi:single-strand DNA-binding protein
MSLPKVIVSGNVGSVQTRTVKEESTVTSISVACSERLKEGEEQTHWYDVEVWNLSQDFLTILSDKAKSIIVSGELKTNSWEDDNSQKRKKVFITCSARDIQISAYKSEA